MVGFEDKLTKVRDPVLKLETILEILKTNELSQGDLIKLLRISSRAIYDAAYKCHINSNVNDGITIAPYSERYQKIVDDLEEYFMNLELFQPFN